MGDGENVTSTEDDPRLNGDTTVVYFPRHSPKIGRYNILRVLGRVGSVEFFWHMTGILAGRL
jgi:hypothetical protein